MEIVDLNEVNLYMYEDYLDSDMSENIGREFFRCIAACDDRNFPKAAMIWQLGNMYDDYEPTTSTIEWMRVSDQAAGKLLLEAYDDMIFQDEVELSVFEFDESAGQETIELLEDAGFELSRTESRRVELRMGDFKRIKISKNLRTPSYIKSLNSLKKRVFRRGAADCVYNIRRKLPADFIKLPMEWYEPDISSFEESDGECTGFLLVHKCASGKLRIELLADWGADQKTSILYMIRHSLKQAFKDYPDETPVTIVRRDDASNNLVAYFFPQASGKSCMWGERKE